MCFIYAYMSTDTLLGISLFDNRYLLTNQPSLSSKARCELRWLLQHHARSKTNALNLTALDKIAAQALGQVTLKRRP